ncbi:MAG: DUF5916 domain-containing protein [Bacteroidota bacterium]
MTRRILPLRSLLLFCSLFLIAAAPTTVLGQLASSDPIVVPETDDPFEPAFKPSLYISKRAGEINIDGVIDEAGWRAAARAENFSETFPEEQARPPIDIAAFFTYDDENLYVAFDIKDNPADIRVNYSDRDAIWQDDYVGLAIDTNGDAQEVYFIAANPLGIQGDTRITRNNEDLGFNLVYKSEGRVHEGGYQVEMQIPFRSLRFPETDIQTWNATVWITHPRDSRNTYSWAAMSRDNPCWACQFGSIEGIEGVRSAGNLEILPAFTGTQASQLNDFDNPDSGFDSDRINTDPSLNVKYGITSDLTADLAINPDFSQIEADVAQIDANSTFALFFPERRPFFQEGSDLFDTEVQTVYTRSINDPIVANKMTGRFGKTNVAYIGARDNTSPLLMPFEESSELVNVGKSFSNIVRVKHNFENNSYIGGLVTDRRQDEGGGGTTVSLDATWRIATQYLINAQWVGSRTEEVNDPTLSEGFNDETFDNGNHTAALDGETYNGHAMTFEFLRDGRHYWFEVGYEQLSPTFRADNGFIRQNNVRDFGFFNGFNIYPEKINFIDRISPRAGFGREWNFDGLQKEDFGFIGMFVQMKAQSRAFVGYSAERELFRGTEFDGIHEWDFFAASNFSEFIQLGVELETGKAIARNVDTPELGKSFNYAAFATIRPTSRLSFEPTLSYSRLEDSDTGENFFSGYILRVRTNYQFSRRLFLRTVVQYNDFAERLEVDPLLTYRINPFSAFYIGSTHDYNTFPGRTQDASRFLQESRRQFFFKFQYLFRT